MPIDNSKYVAYAALNPDEQARVDDCFVSGAFRSGTFWVVFSRNGDLYHVLGVWPTEAEAVSALRAGPTADLRWTRADIDALAYTSKTAPVSAGSTTAPYTETSLFVVAHPCWTEQAICDALSGASVLRRHPDQDDIVAIELRVTVRGATAPVIYSVNPRSDAIFLTPGAWNLFSAPHYKTTFGNRFLAALRKYLGEAAAAMLRDAKD